MLHRKQNDRKYGTSRATEVFVEIQEADPRSNESYQIGANVISKQSIKCVFCGSSARLYMTDVQECQWFMCCGSCPKSEKTLTIRKRFEVIRPVEQNVDPGEYRMSEDPRVLEDIVDLLEPDTEFDPEENELEELEDLWTTDPEISNMF